MSLGMKTRKPKLHKKDPSKVPIAKLDAARTALNLALMVNAEKTIRWSGARFYQQKNKISMMLAAKLSLKFHSFMLPKIWIQDGSMTLNPQRILQTFQAFYTKRYQRDNTTDKSKIDSFLDDLPIPTLH